MTGIKYIPSSHGSFTMEKQFGHQPVAFPLRATVKDLTVHDSTVCQFTSLNDYLPTGCQVFMLDLPHYGSQGEVLDLDLEKRRVRINLSIIDEPNLNALENQFYSQTNHNEQYFPVDELAKSNGISDDVGLFSQITGCVFIIPGKAEDVSQQQKPYCVNVGLNLKSTKRQEEVPGFTKYEDFQWLYSNKCAEIFKGYKNKFLKMFKLLSKSFQKGDNNIYVSAVIPPTWLKDVEEYIDGLECKHATSQKIGAKIVPEGVILSLQQEIDNMDIKRKDETKQVEPHILYRPIIRSGTLIPDPSATYMLFDRVVNTRQECTVPFGLRGTVVGIYPEEVEVNTMYEVLFDKDFSGGIAIRNSSNRGYKMSPSALLNLSHGIYPEEVEVNTMYEGLFDEDFSGGISIRNSSNRGYKMSPSALLNLSHGQRKKGVNQNV